MSLAVCGVSLLVAAFGAAKLAMPAIDAWSAGKELVFGATVIALIGASFMMSRALAQRATPSG